MNQSSALPPLGRLADHLLPGGLGPFIAERRGRTKPRSWNRIARDLWVETGGEVDATGVSVKAWSEALLAGDEPEAATA